MAHDIRCAYGADTAPTNSESGLFESESLQSKELLYVTAR